jgi:alpha-methylacyl-CoA racemase
VFEGKQACVTPVLQPDEVWHDPQIRTRAERIGGQHAVPAIPRFSRTPIAPVANDTRDRSVEVLASIGLNEQQIAVASPASERGQEIGLGWPPAFTG